MPDRTRLDDLRSPVAGAGDDDRPTSAFDLASIEAPRWGDRLDGLVRSATPGQVLGGIALCCAVAVVVWALRPTPPATEDVLPMAGAATDVAVTPDSPVVATTTTVAADLWVHAAGAVATTGVYRLEPGARVVDLLDAAGGASPSADLDRLNLAGLLVDGERVYVPAVGEVGVPDTVSSGAPATDPAASPDGVVGPVGLNRASSAELEALPGVGPATAAAIIEHREQRGPFRSVDDLLDVPGIGEAKLAQVRDLVVID